jgi:hypothetical protein
MKPDYGPTVVAIVAGFAFFAIILVGFVVPLLASVGQRIAAVAS